MKNIKKFILLAVVLFYCFGANAQKMDEIAIEQKINEIASTIRTLQCDFVQTKQLKLLNDKMVSYGKLFYQQGNKLRWEYISPYTYTFVLNNSQVVIKKNDRNDVIDVNQSNIFKEIVRIMVNCVVGKSLTDEQDFSVIMSESNSEWMAQLTPKRKEMKKLFKEITLRFDKQKLMVASVELIENNGDITLIELKNIQTNSPIDAKIFNVN